MRPKPPEEFDEKIPVVDAAPSGQVCGPVRRILWGCGGECREKDGPAAGEPPQRIPGAPSTQGSGFCCCRRSKSRREFKPPGGDTAAALGRRAGAVVPDGQAGDELLQRNQPESKDGSPVYRSRRHRDSGARGHVPGGGLGEHAGRTGEGTDSAGPGCEFDTAEIPPRR